MTRILKVTIGLGVAVGVAAVVLLIWPSLQSDGTEPGAIELVAFQWGWTPETITVKEGEKVTLRITSSDVVHGFGLPDYGIEELVYPGKITRVTFVADKAGEFTFVCTSFCGVGHFEMRGTLKVE